MGTTPSPDAPPDLFAQAQKRALDPSVPYVDIDELRNAEHLLVVISQRRSNGTITFAVFKEFERDSEMQRTGFIPERLHPAMMDLLKLVPNHIDQLRKNGRLVFKEKSASSGR